MLGPGYWARTRAGALLLGAGGAARAIVAYMLSRDDRTNHPASLVVVDRDPARLNALQALAAHLATPTHVEFVLSAESAANDELLDRLPSKSLVVNATGMGKDRPGSPLTDRAVFPQGSVIWELNYRGDLTFLRQARAQEATRDLHVYDGWLYFVHGWTQVLGRVFNLNLSAEVVADLERLAAESVR